MSHKPRLELHAQRAKRRASEIFLSRHQCSWIFPIRRLLATALRKKTFTFLPGHDCVNVECSKCGEREEVTALEIHAWSYRI